MQWPKSPSRPFVSGPRRGKRSPAGIFIFEGLKLPKEKKSEMLVDLQGQIERITHTNDENGYTIAKLKVYGQRDLVTVVGNFMAPTPGEIIRMRGEWNNHSKYGEQFKIVEYKSMVPAVVYGIEKYLGSGLIKGIGPVMAKRIVQVFGKETLEIIEKDVYCVVRQGERATGAFSEIISGGNCKKVMQS